MKTINSSLVKRSYFPPVIELIELDNEISLQLASNPAEGDEDDEVMNSPVRFNSDPYKTGIA